MSALPDSLHSRAARILRDLLEDKSGSWEELDTLQAQMAESSGPENSDMPSDVRERVLDILGAMTLMEPDEPAFPWNRGTMLVRLDRPLEAAADFAEAARRLEGGVVRNGDEDDKIWWEGAIHNASRDFARAGRPFTAAVLAARLTDPEEKAQAQARIRESSKKSGS